MIRGNPDSDPTIRLFRWLERIGFWGMAFLAGFIGAAVYTLNYPCK